MSKQIANMILQQAKATGADPYTLLATAIVESNLNPNAVGDGGTSYGLYQMHVGGAGGGSHGEARRYLDPSTAIENRARHFRGGRGGAFAASVQRPADAAGYARKVDSVIAQLRSGKLPYAKGNLNAPVVSGGVSGANAGTPDRRAAAIGLIFGDDPIMQLAARSPGDDVGSQPMAAQKRAGGFSWTTGKGGGSVADLVRLGRRFGLVPTSTTRPGAITASGNVSNHATGNAVDFGDGPNDKAKLQALIRYVRQNPGDFSEFYYTPAGFSVKNGKVLEGHSIAGHDDHVHLARKGGKKR